MSGPIIYNQMGLADMTSNMISFSQELDQIGQEAQNLLANSREFFQGDHGATAYAQAQTLINEGIEDGKEVIRRHGDAVDFSGASMAGADQQAGNSFSAI